MSVIFGLIREENKRLEQLVLIYEDKLKGPLNKKQRARYQHMLRHVKSDLLELAPLVDLIT